MDLGNVAVVGSAQKSSCESTPSISWTVSQLRELLRLKGGRLSGKKPELVER